MKKLNGFHDLILLSIALGCIGGGMLKPIAAAVYAQVTFSTNHWMTLFIVWLLLFGLLPLMIILVRYTKRPSWLNDLIEQRYFFYSLLMGLVIIIVFPPLPEILQSFITPLFIFAGCSLACSLLLVSFFRRKESDKGLLTFSIVWAASVITFKGLIIQIVNIEYSTSNTAVWILSIIGLLISIVPFILPKNEKEKFSDWVCDLPFWLLVVIPALAVVMQVIRQLTEKTWWLNIGADFTFIISIILFGIYYYYQLKITAEDQNIKEFPQFSNKSFRWTITILLVLYIVLAFQIGKNALMYLNNDGIAYYQIARMAADGQIMINAYRAPLISWLIAPFILLGKTPEIGERIISGFVGLAWAMLSIRLAKNFRLGKVYRLFIGISIGLIALHHAFFPVTPDMLSAVLVLVYFTIITDENFLKHPIVCGIISGLFAAFAYYAKYYNLPFVLAHLILTYILLILRGENWKRPVKAVLVTVVTLLVVVAPWINALSTEYGKFTYSTGGEVNSAYVGPVEQGVETRQGLCVMPEGVLALDLLHPISCYPAAGWSAFDNLDNFIFQTELISNNIGIWVKIISYLGSGPFIGLIFLIFGLFIYWNDDNKRFQFSWLLMSIFLYSAGYITLFADDFRYYFSIYPLIFIAIFKLLENFLSKVKSKKIITDDFGNKFWSVVLLATVAVSFVNFGKIKSDLIKVSSSCMAEEAPVIANYIDEPLVGITNRYIWNGKHIAYYTQKQTYGYIGIDMSAAEIDQALQEVGAKTFIVPEELEVGPQLISQYNYLLRKNVNICGEDLLILAVP